MAAARREAATPRVAHPDSESGSRPHTIAGMIEDFETRSDVVRRRLITIPRTLAMFWVVTVAFPMLLTTAVIVDAVRGFARNKPWMATRALAFLWVFLGVETGALIATFVTWIASGFGAVRPVLLGSAYAIQRWFARTQFTALSNIFSLRLEVRGGDAVEPGPVIVLFRHASIVDNLLPPVLVADRHRMHMRWVLKRQLLSDPALDVGGKRLPNYFVDREAADSSQELDRIQRLAEGLGAKDGMIIYPEGTRFTPAKAARALERIAESDPERLSAVRDLRHVLPSRPGGTLAALRGAPAADVVVGVHTGLDGFATVGDIWRGDLVGRAIVVEFWRIPRHEVPETDADAISWLDELWQRVDAWIEEHAT